MGMLALSFAGLHDDRSGLPATGGVGALVGWVLVAECGFGIARAAQQRRHRNWLWWQARVVFVAAQTYGSFSLVAAAAVVLLMVLKVLEVVLLFVGLNVRVIAVGNDNRTGVAVAAVWLNAELEVRLVGSRAQIEKAGPRGSVRGQRWCWWPDWRVARVTDIVEWRRIYNVVGRSFRLWVRDLGLDWALIRVWGLLAKSRRVRVPIVAATAATCCSR